MKKVTAMLLIVIGLLSVLGLFASAESFENEYLSVDIPQGFSTKSEKDFGDSHYYIQWDNPNSGSNIGLSYLPNADKESYVDLSDTDIELFRKGFVQEMNDALQSENPNEEIKYTVVESKAYAIEIGEAKGLRIDIIVELEHSTAGIKGELYSSTCLFSTEEQVISLSCNYSGDNSEDKEAAESYFNSIKINGEIYVAKSDSFLGIVGFTVFGAMVGALIGFIISLRNKKKKQTTAPTIQQPVQFPENGTTPIRSDTTQPDNVVYDCSGISPDIIDPDNTSD